MSFSIRNQGIKEKEHPKRKQVEARMVGGGAPVIVLASLLSLIGIASADLQSECSGTIEKLQECLPYSTGQAATPSDKCCSSVSDVKNKEPKCLCYLIKLRSNAQGLKSDRLLQLPSVCKITGADASQCPKLLNLTPGSPGSPDYNIFNASAPVTPSTSAGTMPMGSHGFLNQFDYVSTTASIIALLLFGAGQ